MVGMINEMASKVDPMLRKIVLPPCMKKGKYVGCPIKMINLERIQGRDGMPPCPLFVYNQFEEAKEEASKDGAVWTIPWEQGEDDITFVPESIGNWDGPEGEHLMLARLSEKYQNLWHLDVHTGEPVNI